MKHKKNIVIPKLEPVRTRGGYGRTERCKKCGREWAVSKYADIPWSSYVCPQCERGCKK